MPFTIVKVEATARMRSEALRNCRTLLLLSCSRRVGLLSKNYMAKITSTIFS